MLGSAVIYDACVLYPAPLRDLLLHLALTDLFRARWSDAIHDEWIRNLLAKRPDLTPAQLARTRRLMDQAAPDCLVTGHETLIDQLRLPDPDDRHVLAAAIHCRARLIVTFNVNDFPPTALEPYGVEALEFFRAGRNNQSADRLAIGHTFLQYLFLPPIDVGVIR